MLASLGIVTTRIAKVDQRVEVRIGYRKHMAAAAATAAVRPAKLLVLLMAKRHAAVAAVARGNVDEGFVYELHAEELKWLKRRSPDERGFERMSTWPT